MGADIMRTRVNSSVLRLFHRVCHSQTSHLALAVSVAAGVMAEAPLKAAHAADAANSGEIQEVVVTAQKREEKVQDVPISVGVVSGQDLQKQGLINIDDLGNSVPNVEMVLPFGPEEPQFSIRGVTETDFSPNQSSPIALYVDGGYKSVGALSAMSLFDIDRVEVLRGPQGTLQGRNATGGAVNITTNPPSLDGFDGYVMAGVGNFGRYETQGAINIPLDDKVAVRAAWSGTSVDGYIGNAEAGSPYGSRLAGVDDYAGRVSILAKPTDDLEAILRLNYFWSNPVNYGVYPRDIPAGGIGITPGALAYAGIPQSVYGPSGYTRGNLGFFDSAAEDVHRRRMTNGSINLEVNYDVTPVLKLTSITEWNQGSWNTNEDDDGTPVNVDEAVYTSKVNSFQEELRLTSSFDGPYNFIFGALYDQESLFVNDHTIWAGYQPAVVTDPKTGTTYNICLITEFWTCNLQTSFNQKRVDYASYFNNTYKIIPDWEITLGARYTADSVGVQNYQGGLNWLDPTTHQLTPEQYFISDAPNLTTTDHKWIGKAGTDYHITPDDMVYADWSLGFRGSAYNGAATFGIDTVNAVKPETLIDYEVGTKNQFFDHHLQVDLAGFYYIYRNQQFATLNELTGLSEEYNLPKINSYGFELDATAKPLRDVTIHFGGGYTYAIYRSGENAGVNIDGNRVEETPRWSYSTSVDWKILENDLGRLDLYVDGMGVSEQFYDALNSAPAQQNGYSVWDSRLTAENAIGNVAISLWAKNLFDRQYFTSIFNTDSSLNFSYAQRGLPRTFGIQATYRFGKDYDTPPAAPAVAAVPEVAPPPPPPVKTPELQRSFEVFFDFDKSDVTEAAARVIQAAAESVKAGNIVKLTVTGHTDTVGSAKYNQALSERRAAAVKKSLVADGVAADEITAIGVGKTGLLVPTADGVREPQNRRAEIVLQ
jgi:iron complex outermembrane receptor protein